MRSGAAARAILFEDFPDAENGPSQRVVFQARRKGSHGHRNDNSDGSPPNRIAMTATATRNSTTALLCLFAAAAFGVGATATAAAEQSADKSRMITTDDGWQLRITKSAESLQRVPNLAATAFTREGFVSLKAVADILGHGRAPVDSGAMTLGYQIGCQVDVSNGVTLGLSAAVGPSVGITVIPSSVGENGGVTALAIPTVSVAPKPGAITTIPFGTKALAGSHGSVSADQVEIKVDSCMGPVTLRSYAVVSMSTPLADNSVAVYGDPVSL
jgi:hypothetical protein